MKPLHFRSLNQSGFILSLIIQDYSEKPYNEHQTIGIQRQTTKGYKPGFTRILVGHSFCIGQGFLRCCFDVESLFVRKKPTELRFNFDSLTFLIHINLRRMRGVSPAKPVKQSIMTR